MNTDIMIAVLNLLAGTVALMITAGPMSYRPMFPDRLFFFFMAISLVSASMSRLVSIYDPMNAASYLLTMTVLIFARTLLIYIGLMWSYRYYKDEHRKHAHGIRQH